MTPVEGTGHHFPLAALLYIKISLVDLFSRLDRMVMRLWLFGFRYSHSACPLPNNSASIKYAVSQLYTPDKRIQDIAQKHDLALKQTFALCSATEGKCRGTLLTKLRQYLRDKTLDTEVTWECCQTHELYRAIDETSLSLSRRTGPDWDKKIIDFSLEVADLKVDSYLQFETDRTTVLDCLGHLAEGTYVMPIPLPYDQNHTLGIIVERGQTYLIDPNHGIATPKDLTAQATTLFNHYGGTRSDYSLYKVSPLATMDHPASPL